MIRKAFDKPADSVAVCGKEYKINTDFRIWIEICELIENKEISELDRILTLLMLAYKNEVPKNIKEAVEKLMKFLTHGRENNKGTQNTPVIDFALDEGYIYASFMQQYGIDLYKEKLHWWCFIDLLNSLSEDCELVKIISYRMCDPSSVRDSEKRRYLRRMKERYSLAGAIDDNDIAKALG